MLLADNLETIMSFGDNLKRLRRDKGWTQYQLAEKSGLKASHIPKLERDQADPKLSTIYKLIDALSCTTDDLLMDYKKIGLDGILQATINRAGQLPEKEKEIVIDLIDRYCIVAGMEESFKNKTIFPNFRIWTEGPKKAIDTKSSEDTR